MKNNITLWILAVFITLASVAYQRLTGPTHPVRGTIDIEQEAVKFKLLRANVTSRDAEMKIYTPAPDLRGELRWRRFRSHDTWVVEDLRREGENLIATIPKQPPAGKVIYDITLIDTAGNRYPLTEDPVIIRFKGEVPGVILVPHVVLMFVAMLLATRAGLEALARGPGSYWMTLLTASTLFVGGLILGPIVQKYAFGEFWTGWPFGHDLTDTKTAVAMIFWLIALWRVRNERKGRIWIVAAALVTLLVYLIPHSAYGSELDYTKMHG